MNAQFLENKNNFRAWLNDIKIAIYLMKPEQREQFNAVVNMAMGRTSSNEAMQADYDLHKDGFFTQVEDTAESVVMEDVGETNPS